VRILYVLREFWGKNLKSIQSKSRNKVAALNDKHVREINKNSRARKRTRHSISVGTHTASRTNIPTLTHKSGPPTVVGIQIVMFVLHYFIFYPLYIYTVCVHDNTTYRGSPRRPTSDPNRDRLSKRMRVPQ